MASEKQLIANRLNAQKSRGPKTKEGKEISSRNAVKHGLLSRAVEITSEEIDSFNELESKLFDSMKPQNAVEEILVEQIVSSAWRLRRVIWLESLALVPQLMELDEIDLPIAIFKLNNCTRYETAIQKSFYRALHTLQMLRKDAQLGSFGKTVLPE